MEPSAGGEYVFSNLDNQCLTEEQRAAIMKRNIESTAMLKKQGKIAGQLSQKIEPAAYIWPVRAAANLDDFSFFGISNFVDHDPAYPNHLLDYTGGTRTYDLSSGYNHKGTDIFTWPFSWYKMDNNQVEIIAVNDGVIIGKDDGNFDRSCGFGNNNWNAVYVQNVDGSTVWYGHMKKNSLTSKNVGDSIHTGEYLGIVGSSGQSTGPHLHLEVYDNSNTLIDPWFGPSNHTISASWWANQKPYYDSRINKISTHSAWPFFPACPQQEILNLQDEFAPGDTVYFVAYYQDQLQGQVSTYKITTSENIIWQQWTHSSSASHYAASWWGWWWVLPVNASLGTWEFSVFYEGTEYKNNFAITNTPTGIDTKENKPDEYSLGNNYPNPFNPTTTINFYIPKTQFVSLKVYDILGKETAVLVNRELSPGEHEIVFDAVDLSAGIYYYKIQAGNFSQAKKLVLIK